MLNVNITIYLFQAIAAKGAGGRRTSINTAYKMLTRTEYSLEELQQETKPEGVDPSKLEEYLSEEEFMVCFYGPFSLYGLGCPDKTVYYERLVCFPGLITESTCQNILQPPT